MQQLCSRIVLRPTCVTFRYLLGLFQAPFLDSSSFWLLSAVVDTFGVHFLLLVYVADSMPPGTVHRLCWSGVFLEENLLQQSVGVVSQWRATTTVSDAVQPGIDHISNNR